MEPKLVQAGSVQLEYFEQGQGLDVVVLVHGYASSAAIWRYTLEHLSEDRFRVIVLNNRGAGNSDRSHSDGTPFKERDYSVETFAEDLFNVAEALNLDGFTLVGHSMGGATVTQFALDHQDMIKGLVLLNSTLLNGRTLKNGWEDELKENLLSPEPPAGDMGFDAAHVTEDFKEAVLADIAHNPVERFIGGRRSMAALRLRDRLRKIKIPTMVMGGDLDKTVGVDNILADYLALPEEIRHLSIFHQSGHSPNVDNGWRLAIVLERFSGMAWEEYLKAESLSSE